MYSRTLNYYDEHPYLKEGSGSKKRKKRGMSDETKEEDPEEKKKRILKRLGVNENAELWRECDICHKERRLSEKDAKLFIEKNF